ncbi:MAG: hypothetical protein ACPG49_04990 [Chitinophagales bacterium]
MKSTIYSNKFKIYKALMITYKAIETFLQSLEKLERKGKKNYLKIRQDISEEYSEIEDIVELLQKGIAIKFGNSLGQKTMFKTRIPNATMREGKSGGYRIISIVDKNEEELVFLEVYPKKGKFAKKDLSQSEYIALLKKYLEQVLENTLKEVNINDELKVIEEENPTIEED